MCHRRPGQVCVESEMWMMRVVCVMGNLARYRLNLRCVADKGHM